MECSSYLILGSKSLLASHLIRKKSQNTMKSRPRVLYAIVPSALASLAVWLVLECWSPPEGFCGTVGFNRVLLGAVPLGKADLDPYTQNPLITALLSFPPLHSTVLTVRLYFLSCAPVRNRIKAPQGQDLSFSVS